MRRSIGITTCLTVVASMVGVSVALAPVASAATVTTKKINVNAPAVPVVIKPAGNDGAATFSGLKTQTVTVTTSAGTFASNCDVLVSLRNSAAVNLTTPVCGGQTVTLPPVALTANGTFTVFLDVQGSILGTLSVAVTATGPNSLTPGAPTITLNIPASSTVDWGFQAGAGSFLYAEFGATSPNVGCNATASFLNPASATMIGPVCLGSGVALDRAITAGGGVHKLRIINSGLVAFSVPVTFTGAKDLVGTITPGTPAAWKIANKGQQANYTFTGAVGQRPTLAITGSTYPVGGVYVTLQNPVGVSVDTKFFGPGTSWLEFLPLTAAGTWKFNVDPAAGGTGTSSVTLALVSDQNSTITPGTAKNVTVSTKAQNVNLTFTGAAGQTATVNLAGSTIANGTVFLVRPDGSHLTGQGFSTGSLFMDFSATPLDQAGTWTLLIDPTDQNLGSVTVTLTLATGGGGPGTITPGVPVTATISTAAGTKSYTFGGTAGQRATLAITSADWRSVIGGGGAGSGYSYTSLFRPDGSYFGNLGATSNTATFNELGPLDANGTWKITVDPDNDSTGSQTMTLGLVTDQTGTITPGTAKAVTIATPGQNANFTFTGTAGQRATFAQSASGWTSAFNGGGAASGYAYVNLIRPDGSYFAALVSGSGGAAYGESQLLDATGTWTLQVDPNQDSVGSLTGVLGLVNDQTGTITPGTPKVVTVASKGQNGSFSFTGTTGKRATFAISASSWASALSGGAAGSGYVYVYLYRPDGSYFTYLTGGSSGASYGESSPLDATGTWTVRVDPNTDSTGSLTGVLALVTDQAGTITPGTAKAVTIATAGQNASFTFTGTAGQRPTFAQSASAWTSAVNGGGAASGYAYVNLIRPDGSYFNNLVNGSGGAAYGESVPLDVTGTWTVQVDPNTDSTGSLTGILGLVTDQSGPITPGTAKTVTVSTKGQNATYSFTGTTGQRPTFAVSAASWASAINGGAAGSGSVNVTLFRPDGSYFSYLTSASSGAAYGEGPLLDVTGTWTVQVDPNADSTGSLTAILGLVTDQTGTITLGTAKAVTISAKGQNARYTFNAANGQVLALAITGSTIGFGQVNLYRPDGSNYSGLSFAAGATSGSFPATDVAGTWTVEVDPSTDNTGAMSLKLS